MRRDMDDAIQGWPYEPEPGEVIAREVQARDGRMVLQVRVELGSSSSRSSGRPDGDRPHGFATYLDYLRYRAAGRGQAPGGKAPPWTMSREHCAEADREFVQFYHRRVAWLALQRYDKALLDADHTLALMDFVCRHGDRRGLHRLARAVPRPGPVPPHPGRRRAGPGAAQARRGDRRRPRGGRPARPRTSRQWVGRARRSDESPNQPADRAAPRPRAGDPQELRRREDPPRAARRGRRHARTTSAPPGSATRSAPARGAER